MDSYRHRVCPQSADRVCLSIEDFALLGLMRKASVECREAIVRSRAVIASTREAIDFLDRLAALKLKKLR
jgi:hypothetical protein